jgi:uncharacterized Zn-finger protein
MSQSPVSKTSESKPMPRFETIRVTTKSVSCDGGGDPLGHPRVWLHLGEEDQIACTYCSRLYVMEGSAADQPIDGNE